MKNALGLGCCLLAIATWGLMLAGCSNSTASNEAGAVTDTSLVASTDGCCGKCSSDVETKADGCCGKCASEAVATETATPKEKGCQNGCDACSEGDSGNCKCGADGEK